MSTPISLPAIPALSDNPSHGVQPSVASTPPVAVDVETEKKKVDALLKKEPLELSPAEIDALLELYFRYMADAWVEHHLAKTHGVSPHVLRNGLWAEERTRRLQESLGLTVERIRSVQRRVYREDIGYITKRCQCENCRYWQAKFDKMAAGNTGEVSSCA
jgi:hypothetical protein